MGCCDNKPELIDLNDWKQSGEGWNAVTYYHRTDSSILLKLNSESVPCEDTLREYEVTKALQDSGIKCPVVSKFVTDGERFGYISERYVGKKSFARILSEQPEMLDSLARDMAAAAREFHSVKCDTEVFDSLPERYRDKINSCRWMGKKVKRFLNSCADDMRPMTTCLHGDMHPGNYLRSDKGEFWIDMGRFGYGDPDMDYAVQFVLAELTPEPFLKQILHLDRATYRRFVESFGRCYYGDEYHSAEVQKRLKRAVCLLLGFEMTKSPLSGMVFGLYVKGHERVASFIIRLVEHALDLRDENL